MKPFLDPFPFRVPETRSSIGEVIAEITKADLKAAEAQDLKELPGKAGEAAHKRLHKTIGKFIKSESVDHELDEGLLAKAGAVIGKKWKSVKDDYADWGTLRRKMKEAKKELAVLKKEIATADAARDVWAWGKIKELNAQLERLKNEEKERMKAEKGAAVSEGVVVESHTRAQLEKMTTTALRALLKKYTALVAGGSMTAAAELATIRGLLRSKGAGVVLDEASAKVVQARLAARGEKRGGGAAQDKAADAVQVRLGGKGGKPVKEEIELDEMAQTPARAEETRRLRIKARKAAKAAADKLDAIRDTEWNEKKSPDLYGSKGKVVKPTKKMLKTRASTEKAKETKRVNANKKVQDWDNARKETARKNLKTPEGRAIARASIAQGKRNDGGW